MREAASDFGRKALAVLVLLLAAWILFKIVLGFAAVLFWVVLAVLAVLAVLWAVNQLL
ncbi:MAG TPA: hypothetical protein VF752_16905 [Thermoleophilaceae bacterium]